MKLVLDREDLIECARAGARHRNPVDLKDAIILDKGIFELILGKVTEHDLLRVLADDRLNPEPTKGPHLAAWLRVSRAVLEKSQGELGEVASLSQKQVSLLENDSKTEENFSSKKLTNVISDVWNAFRAKIKP